MAEPVPESCPLPLGSTFLSTGLPFPSPALCSGEIDTHPTSTTSPSPLRSFAPDNSHPLSSLCCLRVASSLPAEVWSSRDASVPGSASAGTSTSSATCGGLGRLTMSSMNHSMCGTHWDTKKASRVDWAVECKWWAERRREGRVRRWVVKGDSEEVRMGVGAGPGTEDGDVYVEWVEPVASV